MWTSAIAVFCGNSCKTFGGALYNGGTTTITGSTFTGNTAGQRGGAIFTNSILNLKDSLFIENTLSENVNADYSGGALSINSSSKYVTISGSTFASNTTGWYGGAINSAKDLTITDGNTLNLTNADFAGLTEICFDLEDAVLDNADWTVMTGVSLDALKNAKFMIGENKMELAGGVYTDGGFKVFEDKDGIKFAKLA